MKRILITFAFVLASVFTVNAQNYGYLNTQDILDKMPEYKTAQSRLDQIREGHEADIQTDKDRIEMLFKKLFHKLDIWTSVSPEKAAQLVYNISMNEAQKNTGKYFVQKLIDSGRGRHL